MKTDTSILPRMRRHAPAFAGLLLFVLFSVVQAGGTLQTFDESVLLLLRGTHPEQPPGSSWLLPLLRFLTWFGDFPALLFVAAGASAMLLFSKRKLEAASLACSAVIGVLLMFILKEVFARPRPTVVMALMDVSSLSFPSGHALMSVAVYVPLAAIVIRMYPPKKPVLYSVFTLFLIVIGFSRLYLGVHYLTDVLAGWALGVVVAAACWRTADNPDQEDVSVVAGDVRKTVIDDTDAI
jgi:undecaprenyl-diphosphatase